MLFLTPPDKPSALYLIARALTWALLMGLGTAAFLYGLAQVFGKTREAALIALYWGPVTAGVLFAALLVFQLPRAMKMSKGGFFLYLLVTALPLLGLGGFIIWTVWSSG